MICTHFLLFSFELHVFSHTYRVMLFFEDTIQLGGQLNAEENA